ncbi:salicylate hydroxylase [Grosmannia clavigera kw1407]|uniref:Salicylate hydroxylase n=1 Tax=Grosmannia clavigera (strain kw1407 / UAMH 11150) TaxID=655863 RepID=F0XE76_GROCL|nr:salicylate hydroxylase [Grosmannia clavigera kw1407]EFX03988.1 salicylate hydroxylase [Grosmannia clavigera kw1407]
MTHPWKIAIIGGGPGGLAAAIALGQLNRPDQPPVVDWALYEKKPRISETGGGITLQRHTWRLLERFGMAERIDARDFFRPDDGSSAQHRDAVTGVLLAEKHHSADTPPHQVSCRMLRSKLQRALLSAVDASRIRLSKKLVALEEAGSSGGFRLAFEDGETATFDLVIGADGIRSVVRQFVSPGHTLQYNGQSAYRTILRASDVAAINGIPRAPVFWQFVGGKYVFTSPLGRDDFELTARIRPGAQDADEEERERASKASWGQPFDLNRLLPLYAEFAPPLRAILRLAADSGQTQEFALFNGPRLTTIVRTPENRSAAAGVALLGDASHPLSGAFGAGAGFAFEDAYTLARALAWARAGHRPLSAALAVYDRARSLHYANLYDTLDRGAAAAAAVAAENLPLHEEIAERVNRVWSGDNGAGWVYLYRVEDVVEQILNEEEEKQDGVEAKAQNAESVELAVKDSSREVANGVAELPLAVDVVAKASPLAVAIAA